MPLPAYKAMATVTDDFHSAFALDVSSGRFDARGQVASHKPLRAVSNWPSGIVLVHSRLLHLRTTIQMFDNANQSIRFR
jgi:hypothetical protein